MLKGSIRFKARLSASHLTFPKIELVGTYPEIERLEIESKDGTEVQLNVYCRAIATEKDAEELATKVVTQVLDRISFNYTVAIDKARKVDSQFVSLQRNVLSVHAAEAIVQGQAIGVAVGLGLANAAKLKAELERPMVTGERLFGTFRAALQSDGTVEQFLHLYNVLLMLRNDSQGAVDSFIRREEPTVPQTPSPKFQSVSETIYTRLRNEFAHSRAGVDLEHTKAEMAGRLSKLVALTKIAIERYA